ncbi:uncharacterized protein LOC122655507 [Telopea speciosissima]|uniref:uncharacterized protein LOC122655507 n=1 Tax=Telopea speciosissima TaxID=54955 RepID=UPI001CC484BD|nr:uncharacterized protein LOC122655507 [Telopea speciosissima]
MTRGTYLLAAAGGGSSSAKPAGYPLHFVPPTSRDDSKVGFCPKGLLDQEILKWQCCLVGHFLGSCPPYHVVKASLLKQGKAAGAVFIYVVSNGIFIFRFFDEADKARALKGGPWQIGKKQIYLQQWNHRSSLHRIDLKSIPIWITLPGLPLHYWCPSGLSIVGSTIGTPLFSDERTKRMDRLSFARICVELSAEESPPNFVIVLEEDGHSSQRVHYEGLPHHCSLCKVFGHT